MPTLVPHYPRAISRYTKAYVCGIFPAITVGRPSPFVSQEQVTNYFLRIIATVALAIICFLTYRAMMQMSADSLYYLNLASQFALVIMGVLLALRDAWVKRHPNIVLVAFALVGALAMFAAVRQGQENAKETNEAKRRADEASERLKQSMDRLGTKNDELSHSTDEIKRVQGLNTDLQNKLLGQSGELLDSSKQISELSKEAINTTTGGESFCYMYLSPQFSSKGLTPTFDHMGRQPLYDIHVQIVDIEKFDELEKQSERLGRSLPPFNESTLFMTIGNMRPRSAYYPGEYGQIVIPAGSTVHNFNAYFDARNGDWNQSIQLRKVGSDWVQATRLWRWTGQKDVVMFEQIPKEFPGVPDWPALQLTPRKSNAKH